MGALPVTLAYFWGDDAFRLEEAAAGVARALAAESGQEVETWRVDGEADGPTGRLLDQIEERVTTASLFGGGTLVIVRAPAGLLRETTARERTIGLLRAVAPGSGLCFLDLTATGAKGPSAAGALRDAVGAAGGQVLELTALGRDRMESWLTTRARNLEVTLGPGAARTLVERVGGYVREGDVDRRRQTELAAAELDKLALYRPGGTVSKADVEELVSEAVPGSMWALSDAIGYRRAGEAATLTERLMAEQMPLQVLVANLHRRLRDLVALGDYMSAGAKPAEIIAELRLAPYRAQKLSEQARLWTASELDAALDGLLEIDLMSKGITADGLPRQTSDERSRLALLAWITLCVTRPRSGVPA